MEINQDINMSNAKERICFVIAPIGDANSEIRKISDQVFKHIFTPVVRKYGYEPIRADHISEPGVITNQIIKYLVESPLVIADLTGHNANVFYELAIRHATMKPIVQIIEQGEKIPFDIAAMRTIQVNTKDLDSVEEVKEKIAIQIEKSEKLTEIDTPVSIALIQQTLQNKALTNLIKIMAGRTEALANLEFDEKLASMSGYKKNVEIDKDPNIEKIKNDFRAVSNLKKWMIDPRRREELIMDYIIPIIENILNKEDIVMNYAKAKALDEIIEIAIEYDIEIEKLKDFRKKLLSFK